MLERLAAPGGRLVVDNPLGHGFIYHSSVLRARGRLLPSGRAMSVIA
jgi:hypothetical protein